MLSVDEKVEVSVIIPCRNPGPHLRILLESLAEQQCNFSWEVIVVDNCSDDRARTVALSFSDRLRLTVVDAFKKANASYARNTGVGAASGQKLLFIDADDEVAPGYVAAMAMALDSHEFVTSRVDSVALNPQWVRGAHGPPWQESRVMVFFEFLPSAGSNIGILRSRFESVGGFPEEFSGSQDVAFSWRFQLSTGKAINFVPDAVYRYRYRASLFGLYLQSCNWGFSNALLYRQFRKQGMTRRVLKAVMNDWFDIAGRLLGARSRTDLAPLVVRLGHCVGRIKGSVRYGVLYL